tara:strand:+ start:19337 stop:20398 length:1062 start_codon:yes stop_codon:yes gene_type:complete
LAAKPYKRGLVVGKFSPLHKGHEYLIQNAFNQCEEVVVISYSRPEFPSCSAKVREQWIKSAFPSASVLCIDAATVESWRACSAWDLSMPNNSEADHMHRHFTYKILSSKIGLDVDVVFTSEDYGYGFAQFLSDSAAGFGSPVEHVCVDLNRQTYPVSGSLMRSTRNQDNGLIDQSVLADFSVQKVVFLGAESTGKSTLSRFLSEQFKEPLVEEYGRELWEEKNGELSPEDLIDICTVQAQNEDVAQRYASKFIFCDTSPITTLCYSEALFKQRCDVISAFAERPYHHVFLCEPDFPLVQDGTRKDEDFRLWQHDWYLEELKKSEVSFERLDGPIERRLNKVKGVISNAKIVKS